MTPRWWCFACMCILAIPNFMFLHVSGSVIVKCAQQGTRLSVKMKDLTSENFEPIKKSQLRKGASPMADYKGRHILSYLKHLLVSIRFQ